MKIGAHIDAGGAPRSSTVPSERSTASAGVGDWLPLDDHDAAQAVAVELRIRFVTTSTVAVGAVAAGRLRSRSAAW